MCELENECSNQIVVQSPNFFFVFGTINLTSSFYARSASASNWCVDSSLCFWLFSSRATKISSFRFSFFLFFLLVGVRQTNVCVCVVHINCTTDWLVWRSTITFIIQVGGERERKKERKKEAEKREYRKESKEHWFIWITTQQGLFVVSLDHWEKGAGGTRETWFNMVNISI